LRYRVDGAGWTSVDTGETIHAPSPGIARTGVTKLLERTPGVDESAVKPASFYGRAIEEVVKSLSTGREPEISGRRSLRATELAFASWESARRQGRVELPLEIEDNPLKAMIESGVFDVQTDENPREAKSDS
jgi:predicted dehydrogenase